MTGIGGKKISQQTKRLAIDISRLTGLHIKQFCSAPLDLHIGLLGSQTKSYKISIYCFIIEGNKCL